MALYFSPVDTLLCQYELTLAAVSNGLNANALFSLCLRCLRMSTFSAITHFLFMQT